MVYLFIFRLRVNCSEFLDHFFRSLVYLDNKVIDLSNPLIFGKFFTVLDDIIQFTVLVV